MTNRTSPRIAVIALGSPFFALVGLVVLGWAMARTVRLLFRARAVLASSIRCPHGHWNPVVSRWQCQSCGSVYHGWVGRCPVCSEGALGFECEECGVTIRLPWEDR
jgi:hypothetical protein